MPRHRATLFVTCVVDQLLPHIGMAAADLLEQLGVEVSVRPDVICCGQMGFNAGYRAEARGVARRTVLRLANAEAVVVPSGSCASMIRHVYREVFQDTPDESAAADLAVRTFELTEYLVDVLGVVDVGARFQGRIAYHHACHGLRSLGLGRQALALLEHVRDAEIVEFTGAEDCCGFGGLFAIEHPGLSATMLRRKMSNLDASGADVLVTGDASCMMHVAGGLHRLGSTVQARHIAELLANRVVVERA
ncbi:MAG: (Fe-S)-binding protein [Vicinamibacterales bacterium]